ncbi:hypothetical protein KP806_12165 [Paenibacillus sp. N4]|uniref:DUF6171 family protein n=1 Tax=Paenibacillus vietnamensis TaxID=2590547 RepID=UPI001CD132E8|nr:DUF6171 family protein [Paenibacillus vietnamensis]MCA0755804.1 hypothetical protein [Paenibacillus vietnamensis]
MLREEAVRGCRGCGDQYRVTERQIERALAAFGSEPERLVPDDVYESRLAACRACEKLADGVTCMACGCIVRVAAKLREKSCPLPGGGRWTQV